MVPPRLHQAWEDHLLPGGMNMHRYTAWALRYIQYAHSHVRIQSHTHALGWFLTCRWIQVRIRMLQAQRAQTGQSACSSGCPRGPMSATHPRAVPFSPCMSSPFYIPLTFLLLQVVPSLCSLSFTLLPRDICCPKTMYAPLHSQVIHCVLCPSSKRNFPTSVFMGLNECALAFSTLVFICHLLLPVSHYPHCSLLNRHVVRNYK